MKNIQVIDGAENAIFPIFSVTDDEFNILFPDGRDIEFAEDLSERYDEKFLETLFRGIWARPVNKADVNGIHGTLFVGLERRKRCFPTKKEADVTNSFALRRGS